MSVGTTNTIMDNFLVISDSFPQRDKASSDLRLFTLLSFLACKHKLLFFALNANGTTPQWCRCAACVPWVPDTISRTISAITWQL